MKLKTILLTLTILLSSSTFAIGYDGKSSQCDFLLEQVKNACSGAGDNWGGCFGAQIMAAIKGCW